MCAYCNIGDNAFRYNPPWDPQTWPVNPSPLIPRPIYPAPVNPWPVDQLKEYLDLLKQVKDLEDRLGCPCEPNKADYISLFKQRIEMLEAAVKERKSS